jgi:hypothetical protein
MTGGEHNSPKSAPTCRLPGNGNKQPHGTMSLSSMRPLVPIGLGYPGSAAATQFVSLRVEKIWLVPLFL